jgi:hypothetical protein
VSLTGASEIDVEVAGVTSRVNRRNDPSFRLPTRLHWQHSNSYARPSHPRVLDIDGSVRTYLPESAMISANDGRDQSAADE